MLFIPLLTAEKQNQKMSPKTSHQKPENFNCSGTHENMSYITPLSLKTELRVWQQTACDCDWMVDFKSSEEIKMFK